MERPKSTNHLQAGLCMVFDLQQFSHASHLIAEGWQDHILPNTHTHEHTHTCIHTHAHTHTHMHTHMEQGGNCLYAQCTCIQTVSLYVRSTGVLELVASEPV